MAAWQSHIIKKDLIILLRCQEKKVNTNWHNQFKGLCVELFNIPNVHECLSMFTILRKSEECCFKVCFQQVLFIFTQILSSNPIRSLWHKFYRFNNKLLQLDQYSHTVIDYRIMFTLLSNLAVQEMG